MSKLLLTAIVTALTSLLAAFETELKEAPAEPKAKPKTKTKLKVVRDEDEDEDEDEDGISDDGTEDEPIVKSEKAKKPAKSKKKSVDEDEDEDENENGLTLADLRKQARPVIKAGHSEEVKELLESFDADSLTSLEEEHFEAFSKKLARLAKKLDV